MDETEIKVNGHELFMILTALRYYRFEQKKKYGNTTQEFKETTKLIDRLSSF